jgi:hypothetical protein
MEESCMAVLPKNIEKEKKNHQQIQLKLSTLFKHKIIDTPQTFGSFYDSNGEKYCVISVLLKYLGYDIAVISVCSAIRDSITATSY